MLKKIIIYILLALVMFLGGLAIGYRYNKNTAVSRTVDSQLILSALRDRGFLVAKTSSAVVTTKIKNTETSFFKTLLWGQEIRASGVIEVNFGVDLTKIQPANIVITNEKVVVSIPSAEIFNTRLVGDIQVENHQGLLKRFLAKDDGYNQALAELIKQAETSTETATTLQEATKTAQDEIKRLVGYLVPDKKIEVINSVN